MFEPDEFGVGDTVTWTDEDGCVRTGQVWSGCPDTAARWVVENGTQTAHTVTRLMLTAPDDEPGLF